MARKLMYTPNEIANFVGYSPKTVRQYMRDTWPRNERYKGNHYSISRQKTSEIVSRFLGGKICTRCEEHKDFIFFSRDRTNKTGYDQWCKECCKDYRAAKKTA
jgi:hypothetical protein